MIVSVNYEVTLSHGDFVKYVLKHSHTVEFGVWDENERAIVLHGGYQIGNQQPVNIIKRVQFDELEIWWKPNQDFNTSVVKDEGPDVFEFGTPIKLLKRKE